MKFKIPSNHAPSEQLISATAAIEVQGLVGRLFGSERNQKGNIAGFQSLIAAFLLTIFTVALIAVLIWGSEGKDFSKKDQALIITGLITTTLGFFFGRAISR